jgi:hypothetical protein
MFRWSSVPVPVVPVLFLAVPLPLIIYITIYILVNYKDYRRGIVPRILIGTTGTGTDWLSQMAKPTLPL